MKVLIAIVLVVCSGYARSQLIEPKVFPLFSNNGYLNINKYVIIDNGYEETYYSSDFEKVGFYQDSRGWASYTKTVDTCFYNYEIQVTKKVNGVQIDTLRKVEQVVVFINPCSDLYCKIGVASDPFILKKTLSTNTDYNGPTNILYSQSTYENGNLASTFRIIDFSVWYYYYYPNGQVKACGKFKDGIPVGIWRFFEQDDIIGESVNLG